MTRQELVLRKRIALTHLRIARVELALERAKQPDPLAVVSAAMDLASSALDQRDCGTWGRYARLALRVAHVVLGVRRVL